MPRNIERDEKEAMRRKEQLMEAGFRLFSQYGIENVGLQRVADAAEVGVATLYNYYQTNGQACDSDQRKNLGRSLEGDSGRKGIGDI
ncbi:MAG: TetR/AcrR family transcriptional regulator [Clostridium fessum]